MKGPALRILVLLVPVLLVGAAFGNGTFVWQDRVDGGHRDRARRVAVEVNQAYVAGETRAPSTQADWMVRAYNIATGAIIWTDQFDRAGSFDIAVEIAVGGGRVFAAGLTAPAAGNEDDFTVRAYSAQTGALLWQDIFDYGGLDEAYDIAVQSGRVVAIGGGVNTNGNEDIIIRAYDASSGAVLWTRIVDQGADEEGQSVAILGGRVFVSALGNGGGNNPCVAGLSPTAQVGPYYRGDCDILVRAYDLITGNLLWSNQMNIGGDFDVPWGIEADGDTVVAVGAGTPYGSTCQGEFPGSGGNCDWLVLVYDARTGFLRWGDLFDRDPAPGGFDTAYRAVVEARRIFVSGFTAAPGGNCTNPLTSGGNCDFTVRAYDSKTGGILWQNMFDLAGGFDFAQTIAVKDGRVVAAGRGQVNSVPTNTVTGPLMDWLVRTYDARTGTLLWQDRFDYAGGHDRVTGVAIQGNRVIAVGRSANKPSGLTQDEDWLVRTYER